MLQKNNYLPCQANPEHHVRSISSVPTADPSDEENIALASVTWMLASTHRHK